MDKGISQIEASNACNLAQSQISRLLDGKCKRLSKGMQKLCKYLLVETDDGARYEPFEDAALMGALRLAIGNSSVRARKLERVIRALGEI